MPNEQDRLESLSYFSLLDHFFYLAITAGGGS
jgi:hypothetical protein